MPLIKILFYLYDDWESNLSPTFLNHTFYMNDMYVERTDRKNGECKYHSCVLNRHCCRILLQMQFQYLTVLF